MDQQDLKEDEVLRVQQVHKVHQVAEGLQVQMDHQAPLDPEEQPV